MSAGRLGALDGLQRGILSLRANWELILLTWLQTLLMAGLGLLSLLPLALVLELEMPSPYLEPEEAADWMAQAGTRLATELAAPPFWLALAASLAIMIAALVCYSFFQAGVVGVLTAADRQAPPGTPTPAAWYRTYSWSEFQGRAGQHLWRFVWLFVLLLAVWLLWILLAVMALVAIGLVGGAAGLPAGFALGCASFLPLVFLAILLAFWSYFSQAVVADRDCGAWRALLVGLRLSVRRLGALILLFVLLGLATVSMGLLFLVMSLPLGLGVLPAALETAGTVALQLVQWLVSAVMQLLLTAAVVAIVRGEEAAERADSSAPAVGEAPVA